jgi:hypothetical protein
MVMNANTQVRQYLTLTVVVPIDYYSEDLIDSYQATLIDDNLVEVKIRDVADELIQGMTEDDLVEWFGIDSEFVVSTNLEDLM